VYFCQFRLDQLTVTVENANKPQDNDSQEYAFTLFYFLTFVTWLHCNKRVCNRTM